VSIERAPRRETWTQVDNRAVNDPRLSFRALGLLVYILSKPDHWTTNREQLADVHQEGVTAIRSTLAELEQAGYLERRRERTDGGYFAWRSIVHEVPVTSGGKPTGGEPIGGERAVLVKTEVVTTENETDTPLTPHESEPEARGPAAQQALLDVPSVPVPARPGRAMDLTWETFWATYPRRVAKPAARKAWDRALRRVGGDASVIVLGAARYRDDPNREAQFTAHPATWLNGDRWEDEALPERTDGMNRTERALRRVANLPTGSFADSIPAGIPAAGPPPLSIASAVFAMAEANAARDWDLGMQHEDDR
jgi:hypothetical protein